MDAPAFAHQRARGTLRASFKRRGDATVLDGLRQEDCQKARFPRTERGAWTGMVTLNSSGGVAGGDTLDTTVSAGPGTQATVASQAAERFYRALPGTAPSRVSTSLQVAPGASLEWLPQEAILFDRCAVRRRLVVDLAGNAWFLGVEQLVFGRTAMGEAVHDADIRDLIQVRRDGRLLLHDAIRFDGPVQSLRAHRATGGSARGVATLIHAAPNAETKLEPLRQALSGHDAGASAWDGLLIARIVAQDGACLHAAVVAGLAAVRDGRPLPRVWLC